MYQSFEVKKRSFFQKASKSRYLIVFLIIYALKQGPSIYNNLITTRFKKVKICHSVRQEGLTVPILVTTTTLVEFYDDLKS